MTITALTLATLLAAPLAAPLQLDDDAALRERAVRLMSETPLIDGHNDVPWNYRSRAKNQLANLDLMSDTSSIPRPMHTDIPRLREGRVGGQFWSVFIPIRDLRGGSPGDARTVLEQIDLVHRMAAHYPDHLEIAYTADDVERIFRDGKIASLMGMEGGHGIESSLGVLRADVSRTGARYLTLTHSDNTRLGRFLDRRPDRSTGCQPLRRRGRARDEPDRHAGRSVARVGRRP